MRNKKCKALRRLARTASSTAAAPLKVNQQGTSLIRPTGTARSVYQNLKKAAKFKG